MRTPSDVADDCMMMVRVCNASMAVCKLLDEASQTINRILTEQDKETNVSKLGTEQI
jgi:hypothetical protein